MIGVPQLDTATVRGIFSLLPKQAAEPILAARTDRFSSHKPQGKNWVSGEEASHDLGEGADKGTDDALKVAYIRLGITGHSSLRPTPSWRSNDRCWHHPESPKRAGLIPVTEALRALAAECAGRPSLTRTDINGFQIPQRSTSRCDIVLPVA
jgi:hypothetical protein